MDRLGRAGGLGRLRRPRDPALARAVARLDEAREWIETWQRRWRDGEDASWAVTDGHNLLGRMGFQHLKAGDGYADVSYWTVPAARGRRVAPRALAVMSSWCFEVAGLHRLQLDHSTLNEASCRVALTAGFAVEGTARSRARHADGWHDMHVHARLATDGGGDGAGLARG